MGNRVAYSSINAPQWLDDTNVTFAALCSSTVGYPIGISKWKGQLLIRGRLSKSAGVFNSGDTILTLPTGFRPSVTRRIMVGPQDVTGGLCYININADGTIELWENGKAFGVATVYSAVHLENIFTSL